jgi:hypothetical protein
MSIDKKLVQIAQGRYVDARLAENQSGACGSIQHPFGNDPNLTVARVDMDDPTSAALLNISNLDATTKQRMPTVMDFNFLPDMGRMNGNWRWAGKTICSLGPTAAVSARRRCTVSSVRANSTKSTHVPTSNTCSRILRTTRSTASTNCFPGTWPSICSSPHPHRVDPLCPRQT